jgi:membrane protease YdiL (CAAX protease family)
MRFCSSGRAVNESPDDAVPAFPEPFSAPPDPRFTETVAPAWHTVVLLGFLAAVTGTSASSVPENGIPPGMSRLTLYVPVLVFQWVMFAFVWWGLRRGGVSVRGILAQRFRGRAGLARVLSIALVAWAGIFLGIAQGVEWLGLHEPEKHRAIAALLLPRTPLEYSVWALVAMTAGFVEEVVFRGYLQRQFTAWTRSHAAGIGLSALVFGAGHLYQGVASACTIAVIGFCFGVLAYATRSLVPGVYAHAWADLFPAILGKV